MTPDTRAHDQEAGSISGPAFVVPADPMPTGGARVLLDIIRRQAEEIADLQWQTRRLWILAFSPAERQQLLVDRLDRVAEVATADQETVDELLDDAWAAYLASLDEIRPPIPIRPQAARRAA